MDLLLLAGYRGFSVKVAFIQTSPAFGRIEYNVESALKKIGSLGAELVVLPELFSTGYQFRSKGEALEYSEKVGSGYATSALAGIARDRSIYIVAGIAERSGKRVYNSAIFVGPGGLIGVYRKAHLFAGELKIFSPGNTDFKVYDIGIAKVGMMICFDWLFPEVARTLALKGADVICHPSNLVLPYCPQAMITRSIENRVYSITANRVGKEERIKGSPLRFIGSSQVVAPDGTVEYRAGSARVEARVVEIEPEAARNKLITPVNDIFRDRRRDLYDI
jgi:predicted amidohydrolase